MGALAVDLTPISAVEILRAAGERRRKYYPTKPFIPPIRKPKRDWLRVASLEQLPSSATSYDVIRAVAAHFRISSSRIVSRRRDADAAIARRIAMYLCVKLTDETPEQIANVFYRDRSTIQQAAAALKEVLDLNPALASHVERLWEQLDRRAA